MRQIAVRAMNHRTRQRPDVVDRLEMLVNASAHVPSFAREQSNVPVAAPRSVVKLASEVVVSKLHAVGSVCRYSPGDDLTDFGPELRADALVGVYRQNPSVLSRFDSQISLGGDRRVPKDQHSRPHCLSATDGVVGRPTIYDDHFVGPGEIGKGGRNLRPLVQGGHDYTDRRSGWESMPLRRFLGERKR